MVNFIFPGQVDLVNVHPVACSGHKGKASESARCLVQNDTAVRRQESLARLANMLGCIDKNDRIGKMIGR